MTATRELLRKARAGEIKPGHKYTARHPDGHGGFSYEYASVHEVNADYSADMDAKIRAIEAQAEAREQAYIAKDQAAKVADLARRAALDADPARFERSAVRKNKRTAARNPLLAHAGILDQVVEPATGASQKELIDWRVSSLDDRMSRLDVVHGAKSEAFRRIVGNVDPALLDKGDQFVAKYGHDVTFGTDYWRTQAKRLGLHALIKEIDEEIVDPTVKPYVPPAPVFGSPEAMRKYKTVGKPKRPRIKKSESPGVRDLLRKARKDQIITGHKYKSRKRDPATGDWVYDYGDQPAHMSSGTQLPPVEVKYAGDHVHTFVGGDLIHTTATHPYEGMKIGHEHVAAASGEPRSYGRELTDLGFDATERAAMLEGLTRIANRSMSITEWADQIQELSKRATKQTDRKARAEWARKEDMARWVHTNAPRNATDRAAVLIALGATAAPAAVPVKTAAEIDANMAKRRARDEANPPAWAQIADLQKQRASYETLAEVSRYGMSPSTGYESEKAAQKKIAAIDRKIAKLRAAGAPAPAAPIPEAAAPAVEAASAPVAAPELPAEPKPEDWVKDHVSGALSARDDLRHESAAESAKMAGYGFNYAYYSPLRPVTQWAGSQIMRDLGDNAQYGQAGDRHLYTKTPLTMAQLAKLEMTPGNERTRSALALAWHRSQGAAGPIILAHPQGAASGTSITPAGDGYESVDWTAASGKKAGSNKTHTTLDAALAHGLNQGHTRVASYLHENVARLPGMSDEPTPAAPAPTPAAPADDPRLAAYHEQMRAANDWRYLAVKHSSKLDRDQQSAHMRQTTKGKLDQWLMKRYGLSDVDARNVSNHSVKHEDAYRSGSDGTTWTASRPEPTLDQYPGIDAEWQKPKGAAPAVGSKAKATFGQADTAGRGRTRKPKESEAEQMKMELSRGSSPTTRGLLRKARGG